MAIGIQRPDGRQPQTQNHDIDLADAPLHDQQAAHDCGNDLQHAMLLVAVELQGTNPAPVDAAGIGKTKQYA